MVKRYTPNKIANEIMVEDAWHDSEWVRASDYDTLAAERDEAVEYGTRSPHRRLPREGQAMTCHHTPYDRDIAGLCVVCVSTRLAEAEALLRYVCSLHPDDCGCSGCKFAFLAKVKP